MRGARAHAARAPLTYSRARSHSHQVVELPVLDAEEERLYLRGRVDESGAVGVARVAYGNVSPGSLANSTQDPWELLCLLFCHTTPRSSAAAMPLYA